MLNRRQTLKATMALCAVPLLFVSSVWAGSYLNRASLLLRGAELEASALRARFHDKELAQVTHKLALARTKTGQEMMVPDEVKRPHPHLLLVLESYERAAEAAVRSSQGDFLIALARAREETSIFTALLKQEGWDLPKL